MRTIKEIVLKDAKESGYSSVKVYLQDVVNHGLISGMVGHLVYYKDTVKFYEEHKEEIWDLLYECAEEQGVRILQFISLLPNSKDVGDETQLKNLLCWFSYEEVADRLLNEEENKKDK